MSLGSLFSANDRNFDSVPQTQTQMIEPQEGEGARIDWELTHESLDEENLLHEEQ